MPEPGPCYGHLLDSSLTIRAEPEGAAEQAEFLDPGLQVLEKLAVSQTLIADGGSEAAASLGVVADNDGRTGI